MVAILLLIGFGFILAAWQKWVRPLRAIASRALIVYCTVLLMLGLVEGYLRFFHAQSENIIATYASQNWMRRYWQTNSLGYRDREWTAAELADKSTVLVLGDSFAAGWGVDDPADRFSDVLGAHLGDDYAVINAAVFGTGTAEQLDILKSYPLATPDVVLLQYFLNDIEYTGLTLGLLPQPQPIPDWARATYLSNFIYWRIVVGNQSDAAMFNRSWDWSYAAYDNVGIWTPHRAEIEALVAYTESIGARLIVVIFPNMLDPVRSVAYVDRVAQAFEARGVIDVLRLYDAAAAWAREDAIVSPRDSHPSSAFHRYVGDQLYARFFGAGF